MIYDCLFIINIRTYHGGSQLKAQHFSSFRSRQWPINSSPSRCYELCWRARSYFVHIQVNQLKKRAKFGGEEIGQHLICLIKYFVYPGREAEALKYLQDAFDENISKDLMSPLQFITKKVDEEDMQSSIYSEDGAICVRYKFPLDEELCSLA